MAPPKTLPAPLKEIHAVLLQANAGDTQALVTVRHWLDTHPAAWQVTGDVARQVQDALLTRIAGDNAVKRECTQRAMETLSQSLAGAQPSPLEQLLAQRVVLDWLYLHYLEALELRQMEESRPCTTLTIVPAVSTRAPALSAQHQNLGHGAASADASNAHAVWRACPSASACRDPPRARLGAGEEVDN